MTTTFSIISGCFICIFDIYAYYQLLTNKLTFRFPAHTIFPFHLLIYLYYLGLQILGILLPSTPIQLPLMLCFYLIILLLYKDSVLKRIFWIAMTIFIIVINELISLFTVHIIMQIPFEDILLYVHSYCLGNILSRTIILLVIYYITHRKKQEKFEVENIPRAALGIIALAVIYIFIIANLFNYNKVFLDINTSIGLSLLVVFLICFLSIILLHKVTKTSKEVMTTNLKLQQIEMENNLNADMTLVVENLRSLRHDMNNHMSILQGLLSLKEYDDAYAYLTSITKELEVANNFLFIDNKVLSVLINSKMTKARQLGISFETEILTSNTPFSDKDLCALVGNILENAIEASTEHKTPYIFFTMRKSNDNLYIQCDNTFTQTPIFKNDLLLTTKENKIYHGIGTQNIRSIVSDYHGTAKFMVNDQFHVYITIPI